ncbi:MAG: ferritin-like domain-containing protein, partial [Candidatus Binataceae bacterium]
MASLATSNYFDDREFVDKWLYTIRTGDLDLSWMNAATERVKPRTENPRRGLIYRDISLGSYGIDVIPEKVRDNRSFAPRGAELAEGLPDAQPWVSRKSELWAHNTDGYYEEAVTRQWNATTDIPWDRLEGVELPEATGKALSQLMTFLTEVEMIATDTPAMWLPRLNPEFIEVKAFIAAQAMDEARHTEVFRKRALTTGHGLMKASPLNEMALKHLRDADSFSEMSLALHLVAEGNVLTLFRFSEYLSPCLLYT